MSYYIKYIMLSMISKASQHKMQKLPVQTRTGSSFAVGLGVVGQPKNIVS
jgi:hypothetical protein